MKKLCLFIFVVTLSFPVFAQPEKGYVYLKNGTILKGKYNYFSNEKKLRVESAGNIWVFDSEEVDSVLNSRVKRIKQQAPVPETPWFFRTEIGILAGNSENSQSAPFSLTGSVNYLVDPNLSVGLGAGAEFLKESYLPVFLNVEYRFRKATSTPYLFAKGGYQLPIEESRTIYFDGVYPAWSSSIWPGPYYIQENLDAKGGILFNPGIGYMHMFSPGLGMSFAFGYQFHRLHYKGDNDYGLDIDYNRLSVKIGIIFN